MIIKLKKRPGPTAAVEPMEKKLDFLHWRVIYLLDISNQYSLFSTEQLS
jgi:hypothetical protein